ncbi:MAG: hypothetical protein R2911_21875 [Caldilineaceae bacterium]
MGNNTGVFYLNDGKGKLMREQLLRCTILQRRWPMWMMTVIWTLVDRACILNIQRAHPTPCELSAILRWATSTVTGDRFGREGNGATMARQSYSWRPLSDGATDWTL